MTFTIMMYGKYCSVLMEIEASSDLIIGSATFFISNPDEPDEQCRAEKEYSWMSIAELDHDIRENLELFNGWIETIEFFVKKPWNRKRATETERKIMGTLCVIIGIAGDGHRR